MKTDDVRDVLAQDPMRSLPDRRLRVLFVNRSYWPDAEATGQLLTDLCESLAERFDVSVLCGQPNCNPTNVEFLTVGVQRHGSVSVNRLQHTCFNKRGYVGRLANLVSFTLAVKKWLRKSRPFDIIVSETDPFLLPMVTAPIATKMGAAYVAYLQDIYPDIAVRLGKAKEGWLTAYLRSRLRNAYQKASQVIVLSPAMKLELINWGIEKSKIEVIPNWVNCDLIKPVKKENKFRDANRWKDKFVVMHSGNMGLSQKLDALVHAVSHPSFPLNARLVLVGGGADEERLRALAQLSSRREDIEFLPYQPRESLSLSLSAADLHVISVDLRIGGTMMPSKLYGVLASATPALVIADPSSDVAREVMLHDVGRVVTSHLPAEIASAVAEMANLSIGQRSGMQSRARELAESTYNKSICVESFANLLARQVSDAGQQAASPDFKNGLMNQKLAAASERS